jgi:hypothetical protein
MNRICEKSTKRLSYYPSGIASICALCGSDLGSVHFKGKLVCEECLDMVKELY